ncbi:MAG: Na/Pi cotransporter family protein [Candidatus Krumholzibacteria bacterium]|nr:Na/Pi cotransporter family protein [Candidatus Krumholzibacteria bacterium]
MAHEMIFQLIGGLGFFLFGIRTMSEGLRKVASERLKHILSLLTKHKIVALFVGTGVTALIQSSSGMTVMVVGFVNAGLLTLKQAIPVVLGANIGTTFTAWIVSFLAVFKITHYALPAVGIGFLFMIISRTPRLRQWGEVIFGFGVLFVGIGFMKNAFEPFQSNEQVRDLMINFSRYPVLGVIVGTVITMLLQSSSATIALVQLLAFKGLIDFPSAIPLILGDNIGTTITAQIAAIGGSTGARRVAWAHTMFNVIGVLYMLVFVCLGLYHRAIESIVPGAVTHKNIMLHIALSHTVFNVFNTVLFLPMTGWLQGFVERVVRVKEDQVSIEPTHLEHHLLETPVLALEQSKKEIVRMLRLADSALRDSFELFFKGKWDLARKVERKEEAVDNLQAEITRYLIDISMEGLEEVEAEQIPVFIHSVNDIERIADHAENVVELAQRKIDQKLHFSEKANEELIRMIAVVLEMVEDVTLGLEDGDTSSARRALHREDQLNTMQIELRQSHVQRLNEGSCSVLSGLIFLDLVDYLEKIGDHLTNIAQGLLGGLRWESS